MNRYSINRTIKPGFLVFFSTSGRTKIIVIYDQSSLLTNCSTIPLITERVQRVNEVMHIMMMRQSNATVTYKFLGAGGTQGEMLSSETEEHLQKDFMFVLYV